MKNIFLACVFLQGLYAIAFAQSDMECGTMRYYNRMLSLDPKLRLRRMEIEHEIHNWIATHPSQPRNIITIPVVVHVVYNLVEENLPDSQILSQIDVLNEDFSKSNADAINTPEIWQGISANTNIQFCLAIRDPYGNPTNGITRQFTNVTEFDEITDAVKSKSTGGTDPWKTDQYLNIWVCNLVDSLKGYSSIPGFDLTVDGVTVDYQYFGRVGGPFFPDYNKGRTATHEVGHYFGLFHPWEDWGGTIPCGEDSVTDTPLQHGLFHGCPNFPYVDMCSPDSPGVMFMNYMEYTTHTCRNMFSVGQSNRMNATIQIARFGLLSSLGCAPPSPSPLNVIWSKTYGGSSSEEFIAMAPANNGFFLTGATPSNDGDVTANHGGIDGWIVKIDEEGNILWQKSFGGSNSDWFRSVSPTKDGGCIAAGLTASNDGDVFGNHGIVDYWIVKLDSSSQIQWQKCFGGTNTEIASSVLQTKDGGYFVAGEAQSNDGDVGINYGSIDVWVLKLDSFGDIEWKKSYGGDDWEGAFGAKQTLDGGYILVGYSSSDNGDVTGNHGEDDIWVVKLTEEGDIAWERSLGGSNFESASDIIQNADSTYLLCGYTASNDGDVSENFGEEDAWIVKLSSDGNLIWQKSIGGNGSNGGSSIERIGSSFIIAGASSADDTTILGNHGVLDSWIFKIDSSGNLIWEKLFGGTDYDGAGSVIHTENGEIIVGGNAVSNDWDVSANHGEYDFWVLKLNEACLLNASINVDSGLTTFCSGDQVILKASPDFDNYQWLRNGKPVLNANTQKYNFARSGNYTCVVSNDICRDTSNTIAVVVNKKPKGIISPSGVINICHGDTVHFTVNTEQDIFSYQWFRGANTIAGATSKDYDATAKGVYKCELVDPNTSCSSFSKKATIKFTCKEIEQVPTYSVYPNPTLDKINIELPTIEKTSIIVSDIANQKIFIVKPTEERTSIDLSNVSSGLYLISISVDDRIVNIQKIIKN